MRCIRSVIALLISSILTASVSASAQGTNLVPDDVNLGEDLDSQLGAGHELEIAGPYLFVGSEQRRSVTLYKRVGTGWVQTDVVRSPLFITQFPSRISATEDWCFVSERGFDSAAGRVWAYRILNDELIFHSHIQAPTPQSNEGFGSHLSVDGGWLTISAPRRNSLSGTVFLYRLGPQGWTLHQEIPNPLTVGPQRFGRGLAIRESGILAIGQRLADAWVHIYRLENGQWLPEQVIEDPFIIDPLGGTDQFGDALGLSRDGQTLVVGDQHGGVGFQNVPGDAHVFERRMAGTAPQWALTQRLEPSNNYVGDASVGTFFGSDVAIEDDTIIVGAPGAYGQTEGERDGALYGYRKTSQGWPATEDWHMVRIPPDDELGIGHSIAFEGGTAVGGATIGFAGVSIFEISEGTAFCTPNSPAPTLKVLDHRTSETQGFTLAMHAAPPFAAVQILASLTGSGPSVLPASSLCLDGPIIPLGPILLAGKDGDIYVPNLPTGRIVNKLSGMTGSTVHLQIGMLGSSGRSVFSNAVAVTF